MPSSTQSTLDGTPAERLQRRLQTDRDALMQSGWYLGDSSNMFRDQVVWKRVNRGHWLVTKESVQAIENAQAAAAISEADDDTVSSDDEATLQHATLHAVLLISYDDCWLTPCGNWKGPTAVTKNFEDLKLTFQAGSPTPFDIFKRDFPIVVNNVKWLMNEVAIGNAPTKGLLNPTNMLRFRHVLFEKLDHESVDAASELEDAYSLSDWPVIHPEAAEARDRLVSTHRVVPLPAYDIKGELISPDRYKTALAGALVRVSFTLTHWFIPSKEAMTVSPASPASNTFVANVTSIRVLVDPPTPTTPQKRKTLKRDPGFESPSKKVKKSQSP